MSNCPWSSVSPAEPVSEDMQRVADTESYRYTDMLGILTAG